MSAEIETTEEVLSGEGVAIDVQPIGFLLRALGALIDVIASVVLFVGSIFLTIWLTEQGLLTDATSRILSVVSLVLCFIIVPVAVEVSTRGRSLGKLAIGARIVRVDGGASGFRQAFIRALLGFLEIYMTVGGVAVLAGVFSARSQRLGDMAAGTYSQRVRTPALAIHVPVLPQSLAEWAGIADVARLPDRLARRISQFLHTADRLTPSARARVADELAREASPFISPLPSAHPEELLTAVTVIRRARERRALELADARAEKLSGRHIGV